MAQTPVGVLVKHGKLVIAGTNRQFIPRGFTSAGLTYPAPYATHLCSLHFQQSVNATYLQDATTMEGVFCSNNFVLTPQGDICQCTNHDYAFSVSQLI